MNPNCLLSSHREGESRRSPVVRGGKGGVGSGGAMVLGKLSAPRASYYFG